MGNTRKKYDYDKVLAFCGSGGTLDSSIGELQKCLNELKSKTEETQESYHGAGAESVIVAQYQKLYNDISNFWKTARKTVEITELIYTNAENDKKLDQAS